MADSIELSVVKFHDGSKFKDPRSASVQGGDTVLLAAHEGHEDGKVRVLRLWKEGDTVFARCLKTKRTTCAPYANVRWALPEAPEEAKKAGAKP